MTVRSRWVVAQALVTVLLLGLLANHLDRVAFTAAMSLLLYAHLVVGSLVGLVVWLGEPRLPGTSAEAT